MEDKSQKRTIPGVGPEYWTPVRKKGPDFKGWKPMGIILLLMLLTAGIPMILKIVQGVTSTLTGLTSGFGGSGEAGGLQGFFTLCLLFGAVYAIFTILKRKE